MNKELKKLSLRVAKANYKEFGLSRLGIVGSLEGVLFALVKNQPSDKEIQDFLDIKDASIDNLLSWVISNWKFGAWLNEQDDSFIKSLSEIIK